MISIRMTSSQPILATTMKKIWGALHEVMLETALQDGEANKTALVRLTDGNVVIGAPIPSGILHHHLRRMKRTLIVYRSEPDALHDLHTLPPLADAVALEKFSGFVTHSDETYDMIEFRECDPAIPLVALAKTKARNVHVVMRKIL